MFLAGVVVLAELLAAAEVFDVVATRMAIAAGGSYPRLFGLCVLLASATTCFLNLDTTAVLLTPVMLAVAGRAGTQRLPLAMTTVWFANLASLLLPVSNLTNLLAADRIGLPAPASPSRMLAAPAGRDRGRRRLPVVLPLAPPGPGPDTCPRPRSGRRPGAVAVAAADAAAFAAAVLAGVPLAAAAVGAAAVIVAALRGPRAGTG